MSELFDLLRMGPNEPEAEFQAQLIEILVTSFDSMFGSLDEILSTIDGSIAEKIDVFQSATREYLNALSHFMQEALVRNLHGVHERLDRIEARLVGAPGPESAKGEARVPPEPRPPSQRATREEASRSQTPTHFTPPKFKAPPVQSQPKSKEHERKGPASFRGMLIAELKGLFAARREVAKKKPKGAREMRDKEAI